MLPLSKHIENLETPIAKMLLWERGEPIWKLHAGQQQIEMAYEGNAAVALTKLFVGDCSRQLGKSTWAVYKCVSTALKKKKAKIRYATAFLTDLEQFIIPAFDFILMDIPDKLRPVWRSQKSEYYFPSTGARIRLVGLDRKPNGLRGNRLDMVVLDEAGYTSRLGYIYRSVLIPAMTHVPDGRIIMISTQPENPDHDFVKFCDKANYAGSYVKLTIYDNPMLAQSDIEEIAKECGGFESTAFRREYLCERVVEETRAIIPEFRSEHHVTISPISPAHRFYNRCESLDSAGGQHKTGALFSYYDFGRAKLVIENEFLIAGHETTTRRISEEVRKAEKEVGYTTVARRIGDNNNPILLRDLGTEFNLHFSPTSKEELNAMVNKVRLWFLSDRIEVHPRCEKLIGALKAGIWNKNRTMFAESEVHGHFDLIAALVYLVRNVPEHENPVPQFFGTNMSEVVFPGGWRQHQRGGPAETLKRALTKR